MTIHAIKNFHLTTPLQQAEQSPTVELDPGSLSRWLGSLPVKDIVDTVGKLDEALSAFNEAAVPAADRLKLLEIYFDSCHSTLQSYDEMRLAQLTVPTKQKQQLAGNILWLYIKLSHGYKIIVKEYADKPEGGKPPSYLLLATFRALELTVAALLCAFRFGLDTPPLAFIEIHQLYAFAEHFAIAEKPVKSVRGYAKTPTIAGYYTLAMIFISLDPRQYESYTLEVLFLALQPFTFHCPITRACQGDGTYLFKINLLENQPPTLLVEVENGSAKESIRYLDIGNFISGLSQWIVENKDNSHTLLIEQELELFPAVLTRLKTTLGEKKLQAAENRQPEETASSMKLVFDFASLESMLIMKSVDLALDLKYRMSEWSVQTSTPDGCELAKKMEEVEDEMALGGLVAVVSDGEGKPFSVSNLACVTRLQQMQQGILLIGLEYLAGSPFPLTYMMMSEENEKISAVPSNGIYLLNEAQPGEAPLIIVNRRHYSQSKRYLITTRQNVCLVVATKLVSQTLRYAVFQFKILHGTL